MDRLLSASQLIVLREAVKRILLEEVNLRVRGAGDGEEPAGGALLISG